MDARQSYEIHVADISARNVSTVATFTFRIPNVFICGFSRAAKKVAARASGLVAIWFYPDDRLYCGLVQLPGLPS